MTMKMPADKFMSSVKVGEKGQIVIPKEVREMFNIDPGDMLLLLADKERGIAIVDTTKENVPAIELAVNDEKTAEGWVKLLDVQIH